MGVIFLATIGFSDLFYSKITEDENGEETYAPPVRLAKAIKADLSIELAEAVLYADDSSAYVIKDFKSGTLTLGVDDIGAAAAQDLTGATIDSNGVLVSQTENEGSLVAVGFRAQKPNGKYRFFWLYRLKFAVPNTNLATKGDSIAFATPEIAGTVMRRNKPDGSGKHPWKSEVTEGDAGVAASVITSWFTQVYEPALSVDG
jgi:phi13 family phage major tail protein